MHNTSYEEYMRTVLGYMPNCLEDTYTTNDYYINRINECNLEDLYPEIYRKVYPLVCRECNTNTMPLTQEIIENMTDNILRGMDIDLKIQTNVKVEVRKEEMKSQNTSQNNRQDNRQDNRQVSNNNLLRDLIRILIIREFWDRDRNPNRPPFPPGRPPMPGPRPPFPGNRPPFSPGPIMPREY